MSINFDHSKNNSVNLTSKDSQSNSVLNFPLVNSNDPTEVLVSGGLNISHISGLSQCLSSISSEYTGFYYTNNINGNCSYSYSVDCGSVSQVCNSIIFGSNGVAKSSYCHGETGNQPNDDGTIHSQIIHSISPFVFDGDAQHTTFLSKACTLNNSFNCLIYGSVCENTILHANFDIVGKGCYGDGYDNGNNPAFNCLESFNVKTSLYRGSGNCICTGFFNLNCLVNRNSNISISITGSNSADWSLLVCNASGMQWLTRASILEICSTGFVVPSTIATYWKCTTNSSWFDLSNWYSDQYITTALSYPRSCTNVVMSGSCAACVNLDCNLWVQPNSIDTTRVTSPNGVCLVSTTGKVFSGQVYGNVEFFGAVFM